MAITPETHQVIDSNMQAVYIDAISENMLLLSWPEKICPSQHQLIVNYQKIIRTTLADAIIDLVVSYHTLAVYYDFEQCSAEKIIIAIKHALTSITSDNEINIDSNKIEIPVYYGEDAGWDLADVASQCQLASKDVIKLHSQQTYRAYALGFTPGFCYLASLPSTLHLARKKQPRLKVPAGAVAIAETQTAVYPSPSPGGWHIIGQTPIAMYQYNAKGLTTAIKVGDEVTFKPISRAEFEALGGKVVLEFATARTTSCQV